MFKPYLIMKKIIYLLLLPLLLTLVTMALVPADYPPLPEITEELSETVDYDFRISAMNTNSLELMHVNRSQPMYFQFKLAGSWATKRPSLYLVSISQKPTLNGNAKPSASTKGFGRFQKDNQGKVVNNFRFGISLVKGKGGKQYVKMAYKGPKMPMVGTLILEKDLKIPPFVSKRLGKSGLVHLKSGTFTLNEELLSFFVDTK